MPATITAKEQNLVSVFSDAYFFEIPFYQRPYAWTTEQVSQLLSDITDEMIRSQGKEEEPYFLGSVVLIKSDGEAMSQVVDGQQRVTTLTILLCVLRELASSEDAVKLDEFVREAGNPFTGTKDRFRLSLRERDRQFFQDNVQSRGKLETFLESDPVAFSDSDMRMRIFENAQWFRQELGKSSEDERRELAMYIVKNCYLVVVSSSDVESAHRTFAVMNNRGLDLSPTDILKAGILGNMPAELQEEYDNKWIGIEEGIGRDNFRDLFAHIRMIYKKDKQRADLQREFQEDILTKGREQNFFDDVLEPYVQVYEAVTRASYESSEEADRVNAPLRYLRELDNSDWIPPAMSYFRHKAGQRASIIQFTQDLERLAYGLFIQRANINERITRYARVLRSIEQDAELFDDDSPLQLSPEEKRAILDRLDGEIYNQPRIPRPLLLRLDGLLADGGASYQYPVISIEHVLPQNPAECSQWLEWFSDPNERRYWTHRLANLVLLSWRKNTRASNYEFDRKKWEYFQRNGTTTFALTGTVVAEANWTPAVLEHRQRELVDAFKREWRLG